MKNFFKIIVGLALVGGLAYTYRDPLQTLLTRFGAIQPCAKPIAYSLGSFDTRFGISKDYFLSALRDAEAVWEKPLGPLRPSSSEAGRELFTYAREGSLKINLVYDYRQQATATLQKLGLAVSDDKASYTNLKKTYDMLQATYKVDETAFAAEVAAYKVRQSTYENEVAYWNARGGAPKSDYERLNAERATLDAEVTRLSQLQTHLNGEADTINALVVVVNRLASSLNLEVSKINAVGQSLGGEFEEGNYQSSPEGEHIDIYEFDTRAKLVRILAHELGHALGLGHIDDPHAIMYRLNNGKNGTLTTTDLAALKKLCGSSS